MIHPREANLEEEIRTSFKAEGSTREGGDPRSKTKFTRASLGLSWNIKENEGTKEGVRINLYSNTHNTIMSGRMLLLLRRDEPH